MTATLLQNMKTYLKVFIVCYGSAMSNINNEMISQVGTLDAIKFSDDSGSLGIVYDPANDLMNMHYAPDSCQNNGALYVARWETSLEEMITSAVLGAQALTEKGAANYITGSGKSRDNNPITAP